MPLAELARNVLGMLDDATARERNTIIRRHGRRTNAIARSPQFNRDLSHLTIHAKEILAIRSNHLVMCSVLGGASNGPRQILSNSILLPLLAGFAAWLLGAAL